MGMVVGIAFFPPKLCSSDRVWDPFPFRMGNYQAKCVILSFIVLATGLTNLDLFSPKFEGEWLWVPVSNASRQQEVTEEWMAGGCWKLTLVPRTSCPWEFAWDTVEAGRETVVGRKLVEGREMHGCCKLWRVKVELEEGRWAVGDCTGNADEFCTALRVSDSSIFCRSKSFEGPSRKRG